MDILRTRHFNFEWHGYSPWGGGPCRFAMGIHRPDRWSSRYWFWFVCAWFGLRVIW